MIITKNTFSPIAITLSLSDIGIDTEKILETTGVIGGSDLTAIIYIPFTDNSKLLAMLGDMVKEIAIANGYYSSNKYSFDEVCEMFPDVEPIHYKTDFDLVYFPDGKAELQVWIEPVDPEDKQYLDDDMVLENIPVKLDNDDRAYLLNKFAEVISSVA